MITDAQLASLVRAGANFENSVLAERSESVTRDTRTHEAATNWG